MSNLIKVRFYDTCTDYYMILKMDSYHNSHMNLCRSLHLDDLSSLGHVHHRIHHDHYRRKDY